MNELKLSDIIHHRILQGAGYKEVKPPAYKNEFQTVYKKFIKDAKTHGHSFNRRYMDELRVIQWVDKLSAKAKPNVVATCNVYTVASQTIEDTLTGSKGSDITRWRVIEIKRSAMKNFVEDEPLRLNMLLYHELFHCLVNRDHLPENMLGDEQHIMRATLKKSDVTKENWNKLVESLWKHKNKCPSL